MWDERVHIYGIQEYPIITQNWKSKPSPLSYQKKYHTILHTPWPQREQKYLNEKSITCYMQLQTDYIFNNNLIFNLNKKG